MQLLLKLTILSVTFFGLIVACDDGGEDVDSGKEQTSSYDFVEILQGTVETVIIPTYKDLADAATALHISVEALAEDTTQDALTAAQDAWKAARVPWEQSEAFLFGPVSDQGLDPALDSWPVDHVQLDQVLASGLELTADSITDNLGGGLKGFHTIEYLLWGNHDKTHQDLAAKPREIEYLVAVTETLMNDALTLYKAWESGNEDDGFGAYGEGFYLSGKDGGKFFSSKDAMQQLVNGMVDICDEVANGKIADPYDEQDATLVESQFSYNSIQDFTDNMRSVQNIYLGRYMDTEATSISDFLSEANSTLDSQVQEEIAKSIGAIYEITNVDEMPFRDAITDPGKAENIEAAQEAIRKLMNTLAGPVMAAVVG